MLRFQAGNHRHRLQFTRHVREEFRFLEEEHAFRCSRVEEPTYVRYEDRDRFVTVYHGRGDYRVGVEVGRVIDHRGTKVEDRLFLHEIVGADGREDVAKALDTPSETPEEVVNMVAHVARLFREHAVPLLHAEDQEYERIKRYRDARTAQLERAQYHRSTD